MADPSGKLGRVFVSYCHRDEQWLKRLRVHLKPLEREGVFDVWDDTMIEPGRNWNSEIQKAIAEASVAVLLISKDFLASDFISEVELPALLQATRNQDIKILHVFLNPCRVKQMKFLDDLQAVNSPDRTLSDMTEAEQDRIFVHIADQIHAALAGPLTELPAEIQKDFREIDQKMEAKRRKIRTDMTMTEKDKEFFDVMWQLAMLDSKRERMLEEIVELDRKNVARIIDGTASSAQAVNETRSKLQREFLLEELQKLNQQRDSAMAKVRKERGNLSNSLEALMDFDPKRMK